MVAIVQNTHKVSEFYFRTCKYMVKMAQPYPLYDELSKRVAARSEKTIDIKRICTTINNIAQTHTPEEAAEHYREIGALVIHHEILTNGTLFSSIPYDGRLMVGGKGILYYIMNLPPNLQQILAQYIEDPNITLQSK